MLFSRKTHALNADNKQNFQDPLKRHAVSLYLIFIIDIVFS